jgi:hypothetical protein
LSKKDRKGKRHKTETKEKHKKGILGDIFQVRSKKTDLWIILLLLILTLALFARGGLGVREGVLVFLLSSFFSLPDSTLISLLSQLWITAGELLCFLIAIPVK